MQRLHDHFPALCRLYAGGDAIVSWYNSVNDPHSHLFRIALTEDGAALLWVMALAGAAIILDVLVNDWTPASVRIGGRVFNISWRRAFKYRHLLFVVLAFCYAAQPYVAERAGYGVSLLIFFYWNSFQNIAIAFFDARQRSRSEGWQRAYSN
jgi:hypothetical protein